MGNLKKTLSFWMIMQFPEMIYTNREVKVLVYNEKSG